MYRLCLLVVLLSMTMRSAWAECGFEYDPAERLRYYRASGWLLPGISDFNPPVLRVDPGPLGSKVPGFIREQLPHENPYIIEFPAQEFILHGTSRRVRPQQVLAAVIRLRIDDKVFGYLYGLTPVVARKVDGKWKVDAMAGCSFTGTFIDERGDAVFRDLVPGPFSPALIPPWALQRPKS